METPKISVIVPVYKVEQYLPRCIDSILAQTFTDFELLLIDDGSPDNSGKICDEYVNKDARIRVFHKENGGVSSARNIGLDNAKGEWISFIDADDWIEQDTFEILKTNLQDSSVICIPYYRGKYKCNYRSSTQIFSQDETCRFYINNFQNELWGKLYKLDLIGDVRFSTKLKVGEDVFFQIQVLNKEHKLCFSSFGSYHYVVNNASVMQNISKEENNVNLKILVNSILGKKMGNSDVFKGFYVNFYKLAFANKDKRYSIQIKQFHKLGICKLLSSKLNIKNKLKFLVVEFLL